ncbi:MAG: 5-formyltetrahydrofolate cyclo-ligase [Neptuniibacter sp.]
MTTRKKLRKQLRSKRRSLSPEQQNTASQNLLKNIRCRSDFRRSKHIALYLANDGEINPMPIIQYCWKVGKKVYLPVLHPILHNRLWFVPYTASSPMVRNIYGIKEPKLFPDRRRSAWSLQMALLPLVGFDKYGNRMGMGGGYYDRTFSFKANKRGLRGPDLIGLAHEIQRVEELPVESWDIPLTAIISDVNCYP